MFVLRDAERFRAEIYGPFPYWNTPHIEATEIYNRGKNKNLKSITNLTHYEKISVKNSKQKLVLHFGEGGKVEKVVCKHAD